MPRVESGSIIENLPTAAKNVGVGNAARNGIVSALFAEAGYAAASTAIEGKLGWARAMGDEPVVGEITDELGARWEVLKNTYKPYPSGIVMHAVIDACMALRERHAIAAGDVRAIVVSGNALLIARGDRAVTNERDARVSIHHAAAAVFLWGSAGIPDFAEARAMGAEAIAFREKVRAELDDSLPVGAARVRLTTHSGATFEELVTAPRGSLEKPMSDADLEGKTRELVAFAGTGLEAARIIEAVWSLDAATDLSAFVASVTPPRW